MTHVPCLLYYLTLFFFEKKERRQIKERKTVILTEPIKELTILIVFILLGINIYPKVLKKMVETIQESIVKDEAMSEINKLEINKLCFII